MTQETGNSSVDDSIQVIFEALHGGELELAHTHLRSLRVQHLETLNQSTLKQVQSALLQATALAEQIRAETKARIQRLQSSRNASQSYAQV